MCYGTYPTDDPIADFNRWEAKRQEELNKLPKCAECDHPILTEEYYEINDEPVCPECLVSNHRKWVDDYIE